MEKPVIVKIKMAEGCEDLRPVKAHHDDAACDLRSRIDTELPPRRSFLVPTGVFIELPYGYEAQVRPRSGLAAKQGLRPANCVGVCDADYRGEYIVALHNDTDTPRTVQNGDRIAQLVIMPFLPAEFEEVDELSETQRGAGGFGSTGI